MVLCWNMTPRVQALAVDEEEQRFNNHPKRPSAKHPVPMLVLLSPQKKDSGKMPSFKNATGV